MLILILLNIISIFGYATFVLNPQLLTYFDWAPYIFSISFQVFAQLQIFVGFAVMAVRCHKTLGRVWLSYFFVAALVSFAMEYIGTMYGIPFGKYSYTSLLGWKIAGQVPLLIPLSWFFMALPSYLIAEQILGDLHSSVLKIALGSILLATWDLTLDPAMSQLTPYWVWEGAPTSNFVMIINNLLGWFLTGSLIMCFFAFKGLRIPDQWKRDHFPIKFYAANLMLPVGFSIAGQLWSSLVATMLVLLFCAWLSTVTGGFSNLWKTNHDSQRKYFRS